MVAGSARPARPNLPHSTLRRADGPDVASDRKAGLRIEIEELCKTDIEVVAAVVVRAVAVVLPVMAEAEAEAVGVEAVVAARTRFIPT